MAAGSNPVTRLIDMQFNPEKHRVRLTETDIKDIVEDRKRGMMVKDIAEFYDTSVSTVVNILQGRTHNKITGIEPPKESRVGRKRSFEKLEKAKHAFTHSRKITFEYISPDGLKRLFRDRLPDTITREDLIRLAEEKREPKEDVCIYVRYENGTLYQTINLSSQQATA